jgi:DNA repair exonuclease SbcCD ATPase subunit
VTPTESREVVLGLSRERLARASSRLERIARDAAERIVQLKAEKFALERRLIDVETLFAQERQNFEQRASLLASVTAESEDRNKASRDLNARLNDQERLLNEQIETISRLESELEHRSEGLRNQNVLETAWQAELAEWKTKVTNLEQRILTTGTERDSLREKIYEDERMNAQYALHLTPDDRDKAAKAIDSLIDQLSSIESRTLIANEK